MGEIYEEEEEEGGTYESNQPGPMINSTPTSYNTIITIAH